MTSKINLLLSNDFINDILKQYASGLISRRSKMYTPVHIDSDEFNAEFSCRNSAGTEYLITINLNLQDQLNIVCTCPYKFSGLCKHSVAVLNTVIASNNGEEIPSTIISSNKLLNLDENYQIDVLSLRSKNEPFVFYTKYNFEKITQNLIQVKCVSEKGFNLSISYNSADKTIFNKCSCNTEKLCSHSIEVLRLLFANYGDNFFSPNYLSDKIHVHALEHKMSVEMCQEIYTPVFKSDGLKFESKYKNMATIESKPVKSKFNSVDLIPVSKLDSNYGLSVCIGFNNRGLNHVLPLKAKWNKDKTGFLSKFSLIKEENLLPSFKSFPNDKALIIDTVQVNNSFLFHNLTRPKQNQFTLLNDFNTVLKHQDYSYFLHDNQKTLVKNNLHKLTINTEHKVKLVYEIIENKHFFNVKAKLKINNTLYDVKNTDKIKISPIFTIIDQVLYPTFNGVTANYLNGLVDNAETNYFKSSFSNFIEKIITPLSQHFEIQSSLLKEVSTKKAKSVEGGKVKKQVYVTDSEGEFVVFNLAVDYNGEIINIKSHQQLSLKSASHKITYQKRNDAFENELQEQFENLHPKFNGGPDVYYLKPEQLLENYWLINATTRLKELGIEVFGASNLKSFKFNPNKAQINLSVSADLDWFDLEIKVKFGNQKVNLKELRKAFIKKQDYVQLSDGTLGLMPNEWMKKFSNYFKAGEVKANTIKLSNYQFGIIDELYAELDKKPEFLKDLYAKKERIKNIKTIKSVEIPKGIKATLRDYQQEGLNWLAFLHENKLGGCLADDMGLGKTLQVITFLQYLKSTLKVKGTSLVVLPTSLVYNWKNELEKFCPTLKVTTHIGSKRLKNTKTFKKFDIVITTYGLAINDVEMLKEFEFNYLILDESQAIKNPHSKRYKSIRLLNSKNKLVLTGTPIENNTFDLYAQLNFVNPGLLGTIAHFKHEFSNAIDKDKDENASKLLSDMISPFLLRRTKKQVATELPEKIENIMYCEMGMEQKQMYQKIKEKYKDYLLKKVDENGIGKSQMYILEGLTKLRQACNSTALISGEKLQTNHSAKLELLIKNLKEKTGQHKVLVFSQFVSMLSLVKARLDDENIVYEYLDGKTKNRQGNVDNFQNNDKIRVFLISLKAGGTGLNLTKADYVFLIDPWWNPAVENQAIDRCYRIGQTKTVMAYRMICKGTIEEKIIELQDAKKDVADSIIKVDTIKKSFSIANIKEMFS